MSSRLRATRFGVALASFIALAACDQAPTSSFAIPSLRMPASGAGCDGRSCILFSSPAPLNSAIAFADSSSADILLASATLTGKTGDSLTLRLTGEAAVLAALSPDELLTVDIDGVPLTIALHDAVNGSVVHRFLDSRPVTVRYSINRRMQHALRGRIMLAQETVAAVADLQTPWLSDAMGRGAPDRPASFIDRRGTSSL